jgi:DNA-binding PadR family transcriptional regulator
VKPHWFYILLSMAAGPRHGSAIQDDARTLSDGAVRLWPATLYGSLEELVRLGWIEELDDRERPAGGMGRERFYRLTSSGRHALAAEGSRLESMARLARARLAGTRVPA